MSVANYARAPMQVSAALPARRSSKAILLPASITMSFLAGSMAPTPLFAIYQAHWGFSALVVTAIFSIYALALLAALLVAGRISDHVGRRPVLITATIAQALTMGLFIYAHGPEGLMLARLVQGLVTGASLGAIGATMMDLDPRLGPAANAVAPMTGTALGAIVAALTAHFLPAPTTLIYGMLAMVYLVQGFAVAAMAETVTRRGGALASLAPRFALPAAVRKPFVLATPVLVAAWSLAGFYAALGPAMMRGLLHMDASLGSGAIIFVLAGAGALTVLVTRTRPAQAVMTYGAAALALGVLASLLALSQHSAWAFLAATLLAGTGFGAGFQGAVGTVAPIAKAQERAGVLSLLFVVSYLAMGAPAVVAGLFLAKGAALMLVVQAFASFVAVTAGLALAGQLTNRLRGA